MTQDISWRTPAQVLVEWMMMMTLPCSHPQSLQVPFRGSKKKNHLIVPMFFQVAAVAVQPPYLMMRCPQQKLLWRRVRQATWFCLPMLGIGVLSGATLTRCHLRIMKPPPPVATRHHLSLRRKALHQSRILLTTPWTWTLLKMTCGTMMRRCHCHQI